MRDFPRSASKCATSGTEFTAEITREKETTLVTQSSLHTQTRFRAFLFLSFLFTSPRAKSRNGRKGFFYRDKSPRGRLINSTPVRRFSFCWRVATPGTIPLALVILSVSSGRSNVSLDGGICER